MKKIQHFSIWGKNLIMIPLDFQNVVLDDFYLTEYSMKF